jgi:hypothetical protein
MLASRDRCPAHNIAREHLTIDRQGERGTSHRSSGLSRLSFCGEVKRGRVVGYSPITVFMAFHGFSMALPWL